MPMRFVDNTKILYNTICKKKIFEPIKTKSVPFNQVLNKVNN